MNTKLGDLQSYKLNSWNETNISGIGNIQSGTTYILQYSVIYSKETDKETLTLFRANGGQIKIVNFTTDSATIMK